MHWHLLEMWATSGSSCITFTLLSAAWLCYSVVVLPLFWKPVKLECLTCCSRTCQAVLPSWTWWQAAGYASSVLCFGPFMSIQMSVSKITAPCEGVFCNSAIKAAESDHEMVVQSLVQTRQELKDQVSVLFHQLLSKTKGLYTTGPYSTAVVTKRLPRVFNVTGQPYQCGPRMGTYRLICTLHHAALQLFTQDWWAGTRSDFFYRLWETLWGRRGEGLLRVSANRCRGCLDSLYHSGDLSQGLRAESCPISLGKFSVYTLPPRCATVSGWICHWS